MYVNKNFSTLLLKSFKVLNLMKYSKRFHNFCLSDKTKKVNHKLEKVIGVCWELKNNKKGRSLN